LYSLLLPLAFVAGLASGYVFWGRSTGVVPESQAAVAPGEGEESAPRRFEVSIDDDPSVGPADAPVVLIEFSDFNCPYCKKWHAETFPQLMSTYKDEILFVYRDFPVTSQESYFAAQAAECADDQGKFWEFHDALLSGGQPLGAETYATYAEDLGLDAGKLAECIESENYAEEVQGDFQAAAQLGVTGTPTFFINGLVLVGAQPFLQFSQVIDSELKR
jgi:protein-disulfide isomerase